nr:MAG TPA: Ribonuclease H-like protein [Caudoviricetes sp.]
MENNYVAYVKAVGNYDGSATGGAYIILKGNDTYKISSKAQVNTIAYKMELLAIVSVACSIPDGGSVVIFTNNKMLRSLNNLREIKDGANYPELKKLFLEQKKRLRRVDVMWRKKDNENIMFNSVTDNAEQVFEELCSKANIRDKRR